MRWGVEAKTLNSPISKEKVLDSIEKLYNGELLTYVKYMDTKGNVLSKVLDKNGKVINPLLLKQQEKSILSKRLKNMLKIRPGESGFVPDEEVLEVLVALKHENIALNLKPSTSEIHIGIDGEESEIKLNGKKVDKKALKDEQDKERTEHDKARNVREDKIKKKVDIFAKRNKLEKDSAIVEAYKNARSSVVLKLKKRELEAFTLKNKDLIVGVELVGKQVNDLAEAMLSTKINPYALNYTARRGNGIGIYVSEYAGCPDETALTNYTRLSGTTNAHSANVVGIVRGVSPESYIYCRAFGKLSTTFDLAGDGVHPRVYIESYSWSYYGFGASYSIYDRDFDNHVYDENMAIFKSAGNNTSSNPGTTVDSPGNALNIITVGNYNDATNAIVSDSRYTNSEIGNEKPELVAPGAYITAGGYTRSGTSMATPHAAGFAADLMSVYSWLMFEPSKLKALMLSGATNSISGGVDKVGVGGIDFYRTLYNVAIRRWLGPNSSFSYFDSIDDIPNNGSIDWKVNLTAGKKTRVAISWLNRGDYVYTNKNIGMDFDLEVRYNSGLVHELVTGSYSSTNPYETVDFIPAHTGTYTIVITRASNSDTADTINLAAVVNWE